MRGYVVPAAGQVWREKRPAAITRDMDNEWRRIVQVERADWNGFVEGVSRWQTFDNGLWQDSPRSSRKTRVRCHLFVVRYEQIQVEP